MAWIAEVLLHAFVHFLTFSILHDILNTVRKHSPICKPLLTPFMPTKLFLSTSKSGTTFDFQSLKVLVISLHLSGTSGPLITVTLNTQSTYTLTWQKMLTGLQTIQMNIH